MSDELISLIDLANQYDKRKQSILFLRVVRTWPCKRLWEKTAIESISDGCERLHTEVFRTTSLEAVVTRCDRFFELMPTLPTKGDGL